MPRRRDRRRRRRRETKRSRAKEKGRLLERIAAGQPWERPAHDLDVDQHLEELLTGHNLFGLGFADDASRAAAWEDLRDAFLAEHVRRRPGTRPWAWWKYDAPEPRRVVRGEMIPSPSAVTWYGTPSAHAGDAIFESQAAYLRRLDLLEDGEHVEHETEPEDPVTTFARSVTTGDATVGRLERAAAARHLEEHHTIRERRAIVERLSALQGYLALVLLAAGIGFEVGPGWGVAGLGLGLFADAWRDTAWRDTVPDPTPSRKEEP